MKAFCIAAILLMTSCTAVDAETDSEIQLIYKRVYDIECGNDYIREYSGDF